LREAVLWSEERQDDIDDRQVMDFSVVLCVEFLRRIERRKLESEWPLIRKPVELTIGFYQWYLWKGASMESDFG
jgi:hypothetical protein